MERCSIALPGPEFGSDNVRNQNKNKKSAKGTREGADTSEAPTAWGRWDKHELSPSFCRWECAERTRLPSGVCSKEGEGKFGSPKLQSFVLFSTAACSTQLCLGLPWAVLHFITPKDHHQVTKWLPSLLAAKHGADPLIESQNRSGWKRPSRSWSQPQTETARSIFQALHSCQVILDICIRVTAEPIEAEEKKGNSGEEGRDACKTLALTPLPQ